MCLENSLYTIVRSKPNLSFPYVSCQPHFLQTDYLTPDQQALLGTLPNKDIPSDEDEDASTLQASQSSSSNSSAPQVNHLRAVQRAVHTHDGPLFVKSINAINEILCSLKHPLLTPDLDPFEPSPCNSIKEAVKGWTSTGLPKEVVMRIIEETYQRCVGPKVRFLGRYQAFSSSVYGELMPSFTSDIIVAAGLSPSSLFMDLGSGVGNVVVQASLQSGCRSFGVENMPVPAAIAQEQLEEIQRRCRMWGVSMGEVELEHGDMLQSTRVSELMRQADVVLINNKIFKEERQCLVLFPFFLSP
jgi:H3 lysine-79-specific histone-lysine N-methyltransferase